MTYEEKIAGLRERAKREGREVRRQERMADPNDPYYSRKGMPTYNAIAEYWSERGIFHRLDLDYPGCFACGARRQDEAGWNQVRLERCHLIAEAQGGTRDVSNLVILCKRCHREAPVVGVSPQPMIDWINRQEYYGVRMLRRIDAELRAIRPTLPEEALALGLIGDRFELTMNVAAHSMNIGYHTDGDMIATAVAVLHSVVESLKGKGAVYGRASHLAIPQS